MYVTDKQDMVDPSGVQQREHGDLLMCYPTREGLVFSFQPYFHCRITCCLLKITNS